MADTGRLKRMIEDSTHFLSKHDRNSLDQLVQDGEALDWQPIAKRIFVALLILEKAHRQSADDVTYISELYATLNHGCDVELFRQVYLGMPELEAQAKQQRGQWCDPVTTE